LYIKHTNQDIVEGFFGIARGRTSDKAMDCRVVMSVVRDQQIARTAASSTKTNVSSSMAIQDALKRRR